MNIKKIIKEELEGFNWIQSKDITLDNLIVEFPYPKYSWGDADDFLSLIEEKFPYVEVMAPINPEGQDGGVKYFFTEIPEGYRSTSATHEITWSDYNFKGNQFVNFDDYVVVEWDEFKKRFQHLTESEDFDFEWIQTEKPNWSDWYQHIGDKISEKLPDSFNEVEEFGSGTLMPILFKIDVLNQQFHKFLKDNEINLIQDLRWDLVGLQNAMTNIIKAIRNRDDGEDMYDEYHDNESIYDNNLHHIKKTLFSDNKDSIPNQLRSMGL